VDDQDDKIEEALEGAIYKFIGILIIAVVVGAFVGICGVVLIGKCWKRNQNKRLQLVKSRSDMQFVEQSTVGNSVSGAALAIPSVVRSPTIENMDQQYTDSVTPATTNANCIAET